MPGFKIPKSEWTVDILREVLSYNPETGTFNWERRPDHLAASPSQAAAFNSRCEGKPALTKRHPRGYLCGGVLGEAVLAHRLAWFMTRGVWPDVIDHINGDKQDNRIANLRSCSVQDNSRNISVRSDSGTGYFGIRRNHPGRGLWGCDITVDGKQIRIGSFPTWEEAYEARKAAEKKYGFHENHGRAAQRRAGA